MRIEVLHNYGGARTGGLRIAPGVYESGDPALFGLADYLVRNGHAVVIEGDAPASDKAAAPEQEDAPEEGSDTLVLPEDEPRPEPTARRRNRHS